MTKKFQIRRDGFLDYFEVHLSDTLDEMHKHGSRCSLDASDKEDKDITEKHLAYIVPVDFYSLDKEVCFAVLHISKEDLTYYIISHECLHIALFHERLISRYNMVYNEYTEHEERLAYYHGFVVDSVITLLKKEKCKIKTGKGLAL